MPKPPDNRESKVNVQPTGLQVKLVIYQDEKTTPAQSEAWCNLWAHLLQINPSLVEGSTNHFEKNK